MINCLQSEWGELCVCNGMNLRWPNNVISYSISPGFSAEQEQAMLAVIADTEARVKCARFVRVESGANIEIGWTLEEEETLGITYLNFIGDTMVSSQLLLNRGHLDGTYSTLYNRINDFATVFWHEFFHALGIDAHAPQGSGNLMEPVHDGPVTELGAWDVTEYTERYCSSTGVELALLTYLEKSTIRFTCELDQDKNCRLKLTA